MSFLARVVIALQLALGCASIGPIAAAGELQIHVHDDSGMNSRTFEKSMSQLRTILVSAGAAVKITLCRGEESCASRQGPMDVRVLDLRILGGRDKISKNSRRAPLGHSTVSDGGGVYAVIFLETVVTQAEAANVPWSMLLAYTAAHEVGHLVLGWNAHSPNGLMKANWDRKDLQSMYQHSVHFSYEQQRTFASSRAPSKDRRGHAAD